MEDFLAGMRSTTAGVFSAELESGDRFELLAEVAVDGSIRLSLPPEILDPTLAPKVIEDHNGSAIPFSRVESSHVFSFAAFAGGYMVAAEVEAIWIEYRSPHHYRLIVERSRPNESRSIDHSPKDSRAAAGSIVGDAVSPAADLDPTDVGLLRRPPNCANPRDFELGLRAARLAAHPGFEHLICLPMVREMELLEHQTRTASTVLRRFRGRAMLCDEVGLGKTVEAGLILSELLMRGLARSVLILTPPSLINQWQGEMRRKFAIELTSHDDGAFREQGSSAWEVHDRIIVSIHTAKREPHRSAILKRRWDIVIVDEEHHLRMRAIEYWKFVCELVKHFILLLTEKPVHINVE
jgi:hypothetical protein